MCMEGQNDLIWDLDDLIFDEEDGQPSERWQKMRIMQLCIDIMNWQCYNA